MSSAENFISTKWKETVAQLSGKQAGPSGLNDFGQAWDIAVNVLQPRPLGESLSSQALNQAAYAFELIHSVKMTQSLIDHFVRTLHESRHFLQREIEQGMARYEESGSVEDVLSLVERLALWYNHWYPNPQSTTLLKAFRMTFHSLIFSALPASFRDAFACLLSASISFPPERNSALFPHLELLGLLDRYESLMSGIVYDEIERKVSSTCPKVWDAPQLGRLREWLREKVVPWLASPYARGSKNTEEAKAMVSGIVSRFDFYVCRTLCDLRISEIFDIIVDYPDSLEALKDLKECLSRVDRRSELVAAIRHANNKRLLHPGADTKLILSQYTSTIKCLRVVDPPGVLLYKVADPIRRYLRERPDTIRSIMTGLVDESGDLATENEQITPLQTTAEDYSDKNWEPEPIDAGPNFRAHKPSDVVSTLVSIYDSKDLFVRELQSLLAQRLLQIRDGNFDKERTNIEVLKLRFGESALQVCDVMLKDMTDSRRLDNHLKAQNRQSTITPTVISAHFWPSLQPTKLRMPGQLERIQAHYAMKYHEFKPDKKLKWLSHLGDVELELELQDRKLTIEVNPLQAAIIELFSQRATWTAKELATQLGGIDSNHVQRAIQLWLDQRVIEELPDQKFRLLEVLQDDGIDPESLPSRMDQMDDDPLVTANDEHEAQQVQVYWQFIKGMLTNLGPMPIERIQTMLALAPGYDRTLDQLRHFLESAKREGQAQIQDGLWRLAT